MGIIRLKSIYPETIFRAEINSKNVAPPNNKWAEGVLCRSNDGHYYIINKNVGDGVYSCSDIFLDTLGISSGFADGDEKDIFEGDILQITAFDSPDISKSIEFPQFDDNEADNDIPKREVFSFVPENAVVTSTLSGVVYMQDGVFYLQHIDPVSHFLTAVPLYIFFGYDYLPAPSTAIKVIGNMYDDEELFAETTGQTINAGIMNEI